MAGNGSGGRGRCKGLSFAVFVPFVILAFQTSFLVPEAPILTVIQYYYIIDLNSRSKDSK